MWPSTPRLIALGLLVTLAIAVTAVSATTLTDARPLRLHFTLKRSSMTMYGHLEFDVFANPVLSADNTAVRYDGYATFKEGTTKHTIVMVDGIAYFVTSNADGTETAECSSSSSLALLNYIIPTLNGATAISSATVDDKKITCSSGDLLKVVLGDATFVICASGSSGFIVYGSDLDISVKYLDHPVSISKPKLSEDAAHSCETIYGLASLSLPNQHERALEAEAGMWSFGSTACECKSTPRPCLFIHGENNEKEEKALQTKSDKFGDMTDRAPCCSTIKYASLDTKTVRWTDETLQETVCKHALSMSESSEADEGLIKDTILVTHSMGALIVAGAVANEKCSIDNSTTWVSMSAPMNGTMASNYVQDICTDDDTQAFRNILTLLGKCPVGAGMKSIAYMGGKYSTMALNKAYVAAQKVYRKHVSAAMCSNDDIGTVSIDQTSYLYLGSKIEHGTNEHDGMVTFESCRGGLPETQFSDSYEDRFYVSKCNHADTAFLHGDSYFRDTIKPVNWFECLL
ncbi:hypothetical protein PC114_g23644 [Phytophthora cactorum]|nr:hypothetical protein PC114_g23644 [Phytophthora cactorum]